MPVNKKPSCNKSKENDVLTFYLSAKYESCHVTNFEYTITFDHFYSFSLDFMEACGNRWKLLNAFVFYLISHDTVQLNYIDWIMTSQITPKRSTPLVWRTRSASLPRPHPASRSPRHRAATTTTMRRVFGKPRGNSNLIFFHQI